MHCIQEKLQEKLESNETSECLESEERATETLGETDTTQGNSGCCSQPERHRPSPCHLEPDALQHAGDSWDSAHPTA